tara:strand:- start:3119 stop:4615 length:1497 start_codon:yes stop_codon:yes gene_type:complete
MGAINPGATLNAVPSVSQITVAGNYIDFTADGNGWAQQYLPDLMEKEAEVFGNRSVSGFLEMVGAEEAMAADQVIWSEQGRLHLSYKGTTASSGTTGIVTITEDIDGNSVDGAGEAGCGVRVGDTVVVASAAVTVKCYVSAVTNAPASSAGGVLVTCLPYTGANLDTVINGTGTAVTMFVYGSEYTKGSEGRTSSNEPGFKSFNNKPIIMKDLFEVSGSDASQIGWVEVSGETGQNGYLWYLKAAGDTKMRFADYCEMALVEAEKTASGATNLIAANAKIKGTEGLFAAIQDRGNIYAAGSSAGVYADFALTDFDAILAEFDKQGAIEEYMIFANRQVMLGIDDMLAGLNSDTVGGTSYGVFNNEADMAINLGFSGFRRGSYDFYKSDWKYLNDVSTRGGLLDTASGSSSNGVGAIQALFIPAGVTSVYDQALGKNLKRPFLHTRYRASGMEDRRFKTWTTGAVGGNITSSLDAMEMHFLTERCLVVQAANNFMMVKG